MAGYIVGYKGLFKIKWCHGAGDMWKANGRIVHSRLKPSARILNPLS